MAKILSKSGDSLADVYDVEGSQAGVENLESKDVHLVHEMGATIFNERLASRVLALSSGAVAASTAWNVNFSVSRNTRILALACVTDNVGRITANQVSITSGPAVDNTEVPIWGWLGASDGSRVLSVMIAGVVANRTVLIPGLVGEIPNLLIGTDSPRPAQTITMRGVSNAFGAGTVETQVLVLFGFAQTEGLSSRGLPIPGW